MRGEQRRVVLPPDTALGTAEKQHAGAAYGTRGRQKQDSGHSVDVERQGPVGHTGSVPLPGQGARRDLPTGHGHGQPDLERPGRVGVPGTEPRLVRIAGRRPHRPEQAHAVGAAVRARHRRGPIEVNDAVAVRREGRLPAPALTLGVGGLRRDGDGLAGPQARHPHMDGLISQGDHGIYVDRGVRRMPR